MNVGLLCSMVSSIMVGRNPLLPNIYNSSVPHRVSGKVELGEKRHTSVNQTEDDLGSERKHR